MGLALVAVGNYCVEHHVRSPPIDHPQPTCTFRHLVQISSRAGRKARMIIRSSVKQNLQVGVQREPL